MDFCFNIWQFWWIYETYDKTDTYIVLYHIFFHSILSSMGKISRWYPPGNLSGGFQPFVLSHSPLDKTLKFKHETLKFLWNSLPNPSPYFTQTKSTLRNTFLIKCAPIQCLCVLQTLNDIGYWLASGVGQLYRWGNRWKNACLPIQTSHESMRFQVQYQDVTC